MLSEEQITKNIISWLISSKWTIVSYDFPQSGTGRILHPNLMPDTPTKNKGSIIPDIIAVREQTAIFFENKNRFFYPDFIKINELRTDHFYSHAIDSLLKKYEINKKHYGIGGPGTSQFIKKSLENIDKVDFVCTVYEDQTEIIFQRNHIFNPL